MEIIRHFPAFLTATHVTFKSRFSEKLIIRAVSPCISMTSCITSNCGIPTPFTASINALRSTVFPVAKVARNLSSRICYSEERIIYAKTLGQSEIINAMWSTQLHLYYQLIACRADSIYRREPKFFRTTREYQTTGTITRRAITPRITAKVWSTAERFEMDAAISLLTCSA